MGNGIFGDLFAPVGPMTAQGRQAIAEEQKRRALAAMQASPVANKYAGQRPDNVGAGGTGISDTLMGGVSAGQDAYNQARQAAGAPQQQSMDPTWDAISGWLGRNFTEKGRVQAAADAANAAPPSPGYPARPSVIAPNGSAPVAPPPNWPPGAIPGTPITGDGITVGDILPGGGGGSPVPAAATARTPLPEVNRNYPGQGLAPPAAMPPAQPKSLADQIEEYRQIVEAVTPKPDTSLTPSEQKSKDYASHQLDRTKLMAQLAISSGLTAQAGYPDVARGFAAAGSVYDHGFDRYAAALNDSADRELAKRSEAYKGEVGKSNAAISLYSENAKIGRDLVEQRRRENISFLLAGKPPGELATTDPEAYNAAYDKWYREYGQYQTTGEMPAFDGDVRDSKQ